MDHRNLSLQDVTTFAALCFSLTVAYYAVNAAGYFNVIGSEFIGIYFDDNLVAGVIEVLPTISLLVWLIVVLSNLIYSNFKKRDKELQLLSIFWWIDWGIGLAFALSVFLPSEKSIIGFKVAFYYLNAMCLVGMCYLQIFRFDVIRWLNVAMAGLLWYTAIYQGGRAGAVADLAKKEPMFSISTSEKNYANAMILKATANGIIIRSGNDIIFYRADEVKKIARQISDIAIMKN